MEEFISNLNKIEFNDNITQQKINWLINNLSKQYMDLIEIGYAYQDEFDYNGIVSSSYDCAMFEAYCYYKNNISINKDHALKLIDNDGILGYYINNNNKKMYLSVKQLINRYENNNLFNNWLYQTAKLF